jgi:exodeoxyribonuclease VII small subunit
MVKKELKILKDYKQMADELAELMEWFESGNVDIDEAMNKYEQAMKLIEQMEQYLKTAENKIRKVSIE